MTDNATGTRFNNFVPPRIARSIDALRQGQSDAAKEIAERAGRCGLSLADWPTLCDRAVAAVHPDAKDKRDNLRSVLDATFKKSRQQREAEIGARHAAEEARQRNARSNGGRTQAPPGAAPGMTRTLCVTADQIEERPVTWLFEGWIPLKAVTMAMGQTKIGKSQFAIHAIARVTDGKSLKAGDRLKHHARERVPARAVLITAEDAENEVVIPRLKAAGADLTRVDIVRGYEEIARDGSVLKRPFTLAQSLEALTSLLKSKPDIKLVVVDPVNAYLGAKVNSHKNNETRAVLQPLKELAETFGVAVLLVHHMKKGVKGTQSVTDMSGGSNAFVEAVRCVIGMAPEPGETGRSIIQVVACNYARAGEGMVYIIEEGHTDQGNQTSKFAILEGEKPSITIDQALADTADGESTDALGDARQFLIGVLGGGGEVESQGLRKQAEREGHKWATVRRASKALKVVTRRDGFGPGGKWLWSLAPDASREAAITAAADALQG